jgi:hypothetical protein
MEKAVLFIVVCVWGGGANEENDDMCPEEDYILLFQTHHIKKVRDRIKEMGHGPCVLSKIDKEESFAAHNF